MNLSKNFTLEELTESNTSFAHKFDEQYTPDEVTVNNLKNLCDFILQPLRDAIGSPIKITSGYRCTRLNDLVSKSKSSQHRTGNAADIQGVNVTNKQLYDKILELNLPYDQLIWEFGNDKEPAWVHVSYSNRHRKQILRVK